jgi:hypothetical protein
MMIPSLPRIEFARGQELFQVDGATDALKPYLELKPPEKARNAPPILSFERRRDIEIPWGEVLQKLAVRGSSSIAAIRRYFEESWPFDKPAAEVLEDYSKRLTSEDPPLVMEIHDVEGKPAPAIYRTVFKDKSEPGAEQLKKGVILRHGTTSRLYLVIPRPGENIKIDHFEDKDLYVKAWDKVLGVELVFATADEAATAFTDFEELDMRPPLIERKYQEFEILKSYAEKVKTSVEAATKTMIESIVSAGLNTEEIERLQQRVLRLEISQFDVQRKREQLASHAAALGFRLPLQKEKVTVPGGQPKELEAGKLYRPYRNVAQWTTWHERTEIDWALAIGMGLFLGPAALLLATKTIPVGTRHEEAFTDYAPVDTSKDLLSAKREELTGKGLEVFVFGRTPGGFTTPDRVPLEAIMERCKVDEQFRRRCAVMLPVYEESLTGQRLVAKFSIFKRPLPGLQPSILPRLSLVEALSYKTAWEETKLGELVNTINLAPGEERKVTLIKHFEEQTTEVRSSTSIFDITRAETTDLATEMEDLVREESETSAEFHFGTKVSGGLFGATAEATAGGGASTSLNELSQSIGRVARRATQSLSQQNREEVSSTRTTQISVGKRDETVASIRNINQGRSLNLMFYRLYNKYTGGLYLDGLHFEVIPSVELIAGSGVYQSKSYDLGQLPAVMAHLGPESLPFDIPSDRQALYRDRIAEAVEKLLLSEYAKDGKTDRRNGTIDVPSLSVERVLFVPPDRMRSAQRGAGEATEGDSRVDELADSLRKLSIDSKDPIYPQALLVTAPALYLDATVGARPGTEPYSEQMRAQEVRMRAAEVFVKQSEGVYKQAMAIQLATLNGLHQNRLTGVLPDPAKNTLRLAVKAPLAPGDWHVLFDGNEKAKVDVPDGRLMLSHSWVQPQEWLGADDLMARITLMDELTGTVVRF